MNLTKIKLHKKMFELIMNYYKCYIPRMFFTLEALRRCISQYIEHDFNATITEKHNLHFYYKVNFILTQNDSSQNKFCVTNIWPNYPFICHNTFLMRPFVLPLHLTFPGEKMARWIDLNI